MAENEYRPDCGYAWVVVAACFTINFIMAGLARAAGVLYIALIDVYGVSREVATAPFSLRFCLRNLSGPVVGALGQRFGIRPVVLLGGLICGLGGILSALAPDVMWITAAWGGVHGVGYGMCNLIHLIVVNRYFDKYKGLALGVSLSGDCVGTFLLPLLMEFLLSVYDLQGTFLILAGISLNVVPAAMLLKSPSWEKTPLKVSQKETEPIKYNNRIYQQGLNNEGYDYTAEEHGVKVGMSDIQNHILPSVIINEPENNQICNGNEQTVNDKETWKVDVCFKYDRTPNDNETGTSGVDVCFKYDQISNDNEAATSDVGVCFKYDETVRNKIKTTEMVEADNKACIQYIDFNNCNIHKNVRNDSVMSDIRSLTQSVSLRVTNGKMKKTRFRCNSSSFNTQNRRTSATSVLSCPPNFGKYILDTLHKSSINMNKVSLESLTDLPPQYSQKQNLCFPNGNDLDIINESVSVGRPSTCNNEMHNQINVSIIPVSFQGEKDLNKLELYDWNATAGNEIANKSTDVSKPNALLNFLRTNTKPIFLVISATLALYVFLFISVFTIIVDYVNDNGIPSEFGSYLIIAFSVTDFFGRIGSGVVLDKKWIAQSHFAGLTVGLMGLFVLIIPFYKCFSFWMISLSLCGFVQGGVAMMFPMLVETYMDKNEETIALGCLNFYGGILMLPIPPMIGYFRDNIGSYDGVFWTTGALCILVASLWAFEPCLIQKTKRHNVENTNYNRDERNT